MSSAPKGGVITETVIHSALERCKLGKDNHGHYRLVQALQVIHTGCDMAQLLGHPEKWPQALAVCARRIMDEETYFHEVCRVLRKNPEVAECPNELLAAAS